MRSFEVIKQDRVVAVIRGRRVADPKALTETLVGAGIRSVEFTFTIPDALSIVEAAASHANVGAGTALTAEQAESAIEAGAAFIVSPALKPEVAAVAKRRGVPVFLGAFTPSEIVAAFEAGATAVKLFPARIGGPKYVADLRGPLPHVTLIPSGGIREDNARDYLAAGAIAVYAGSSLAPPALVETGDYEEIGRRAKSFVAALK